MRALLYLLVLLPLPISSVAHAGVFTDDLSRCVVEKSSDADKTQMMRWMFAAVTRDPSLADMVNVTPAERTALNKTMASIYSRLILVDCRSQAVAALRNEGETALGESSRVLGGASARKMMTSPATQEELAKFGELMDKKAWEALGTEAGMKLRKD